MAQPRNRRRPPLSDEERAPLIAALSPDARADYELHAERVTGWFQRLAERSGAPGRPIDPRYQSRLMDRYLVWRGSQTVEGRPGRNPGGNGGR
jgi:hypothetical protein